MTVDHIVCAILGLTALVAVIVNRKQLIAMYHDWKSIPWKLDD